MSSFDGEFTTSPLLLQAFVYLDSSVMFFVIQFPRYTYGPPGTASFLVFNEIVRKGQREREREERIETKVLDGLARSHRPPPE